MLLWKRMIRLFDFLLICFRYLCNYFSVFQESKELSVGVSLVVSASWRKWFCGKSRK